MHHEIPYPNLVFVFFQNCKSEDSLLATAGHWSHCHGHCYVDTGVSAAAVNDILIAEYNSRIIDERTMKVVETVTGGISSQKVRVL